MLLALGYGRDTDNDILREFPLSYDRTFLGLKKKNDPPLRGRADYILSVRGAGRWVLEIKAPKNEIDQDAIEQAISYARHPQVSGTYAAILNGKRFVVMFSTQSSNDKPILDISVSTPDGLAAQLQGLLSPEAIRRDCTPPIVDVQQPLAAGFRSRAAIKGGSMRYSKFDWSANFTVPDSERQNIEEACRRLTGYRANIIGGSMWRDDTSRIKARLEWSVPNDDVLQFALDKHLMDAEYISLQEDISSNPENPTMFDMIGQIRVQKGEAVFDIVKWKKQEAGIEVSMTYHGQASGYLRDGVFIGLFQYECASTFPGLGVPFEMSMYGLGEFEIILDTR